MFSNEQIAIQATQYIISLLESSKWHTEEALDNLPGIYVIIDGQGQILKGNKGLAGIFDLNHENLLGLNLSQIFSKENWHLFQKLLTEVASKNLNDLRFKNNIRNKEGLAKNYFW